MPKQSLIINEFNGMSPAISGGQSCILLSGADVTTSNSIIAQEKTDSKTTLTGLPTIVDAVKTTIDGVELKASIDSVGRLYLDDEQIGSTSAITSSIATLGNSIVVSSAHNTDPVVISRRSSSANSIFGDDNTIVESDVITNDYANAGTAKKMVALNDEQVLLFTGGSKCLTIVDVANGEHNDSKDVTDGEIIDFACLYSIDGSTVLCEDVYILTMPLNGSTPVIKRYNVDGAYTNGETNDSTKFVPATWRSSGLHSGSVGVSETHVMFGRKLRTMAVSDSRIFLSIDGIIDALDIPVADRNSDTKNDFLFAIEISDWPSSGQQLAGVEEDIKLHRSMLPLWYETLSGITYGAMVIDGSLAVIGGTFVGVHSRTTSVLGINQYPASHILCWDGEEQTSSLRMLVPDHSFIVAFGSNDSNIGSCIASFHTCGIHHVVYKTGGSGYTAILPIPVGLDLSVAAYWAAVIYTVDGIDGLINIDFDGIFSISPNSSSAVRKIMQFEDSVVLKRYAFDAIIPDVGYENTTILVDLHLAASAVDEETTYGVQFLDTSVSSSAGSILADKITKYKYTFMYSGTTEGPLSKQYFTATDSSDYKVSITINMTPEMMDGISKRVTAINIYACEADEEYNELSYYRKVCSLPLTKAVFSLSSPNYVASYVDTGTRLESFEASSGYPEGLRTISVRRGCQCAYMGHIYAGDITVQGEDSTRFTRNVVVRSLPLQPSAFNYANDFAVVPFTPTAIIGSSGRLYVFSKDSYCILNPSTMAIDAESKALGVLGQQQVISTDYGVFCIFNKNVYHVDGLNVESIGNPVLTHSTTGTYSLSMLADDSVIVYNKQKEAVVIVGTSVSVEDGSTKKTLRAFAYSLKTGKWCHYEIAKKTITGGDVPEHKGDIKGAGTLFKTFRSYAYDDKQYVVFNGTEYQLFNGTTYRELDAIFRIDTGDSAHKAYLYDAEAQLNGQTNTSVDATVNGAIMPNTVTLYRENENKIALHIDESTAQNTIDSIRMTIRKLELT